VVVDVVVVVVVVVDVVVVVVVDVVVVVVVVVTCGVNDEYARKAKINTSRLAAAISRRTVFFLAE
jgi:hypothetical protein